MWTYCSEIINQSFLSFSCAVFPHTHTHTHQIFCCCKFICLWLSFFNDAVAALDFRNGQTSTEDVQHRNESMSKCVTLWHGISLAPAIWIGDHLRAMLPHSGAYHIKTLWIIIYQRRNLTQPKARRERETSNTQNVHFEYIINAIILWKEEGKKVSRFFSCERLGFLAHNIKKGQPTTSLYFDKQQTLLLMWASFSHLSTHRDYLCRN